MLTSDIRAYRANPRPPPAEVTALYGRMTEIHMGLARAERRRQDAVALALTSELREINHTLITRTG